MKIDFKYWTIKYLDIFDNKTWNKILRYYILYSIWITESNNEFEVLMKLVLALMYNIDLKN